jgi:hypothetical protein
MGNCAYIKKVIIILSFTPYAPLGTPTKRQVSKRQVSKRQVSKRLVLKRPVFKFDILIKQKVWELPSLHSYLK